MTIAVLFGSFNPITNAHISILKSAVQHLGADKGLFVATNGKYLKRKTVKIDDAFYLTEDERREIIENICTSETNLEFWGFELGGINPKRYKTLAKIQTQYPNAVVYEVQGADKVRSISKFGDAEEYLTNIKLAVFGRAGIDLDSLISSDPLLAQHRNSFTLLPALAEGSEISSTEVRRRFYSGEDYSDIIPEAAVEVLDKHKPSDFSISFEERMKVMMASGRFGAQNARKEIYKLNTKLFHDWQNGTADIDLGDHKAFIDGAKLYKEPFDVSGRGTVYESTQTGCINMDCMEVAEYLLSLGYNPAILNLASAKRPCGGWDAGMGSQEESLCFASNLSQSLYQFGDPKYKNVRDSGVSVREVGYPLNLNYGGIYSPGVTFFRNNISKYYTLRDEPFKCDVITVAGLSFNGRMDYAYADELSYRSETGGFTPEGEEIMLNKIRTIFRLGVEHGKDSIVAGALSCGAYKCPPDEVARQFRTVIEEPEFKNKFRLIIFAILEKPKAPHDLEGKFAPFYREFGSYNLLY